MGFGIVLGGVADGFRAQQKADDEHDEQQYQKYLRDQDKAARKEVAALAGNSPVGKVVGSRGQSYTPDQVAGQYGLSPDTVAGLQTAEDWNKYIQNLPPPPTSTPNEGPSGATAGDMTGGAPMPAGAVPAGDEPVGSQVPTTAAPAIPVDSAPLAPPPAAAPAPAPAQPVARPAAAPVPAASASPPTPLLATVGPDRAHVASHIYSQATNQGLRPAAVQAAVIAPYFESSYNPSAQNGSSFGLYGFQKPTFTGLGGTDQTIMNPDTQIAAGIKNMQGGDWYLSKVLGRDPTPTEIYLYHQQGPKGSQALLTSDPSKPAAQALVDAGVYHNHTAALQAINGNLPKGVPGNPTVGQFVGGWDAKTKAVLGDVPRPSGQVAAIDAPAGGNTPLPSDMHDRGGAVAPQPTPQPASFGLPGSDRQTPTGDAASSPGGMVAYTTKDANGQDVVRFTSQPRYGTADDHDQAVVGILQKHGMYDKAEALQQQILQRGLLRHQVEQGGLELDSQKRYQGAAVAAQTGDFSKVEDAFNSSAAGMNTGTHIRVGVGPGGQVAVGTYSNDTGQLLATQPYANANEFAQHVAQLSDPKLLTQTMLQMRQLNIEQQNANSTSQNAQSQARQVGVAEKAEASMEPVRASQVNMQNTEATATAHGIPGIDAEVQQKQNVAGAQGRVINAAPGSAAQAQAAGTIRAMGGALPTPPQPVMVGVGQVAFDPQLGTQVTGVMTKGGTVVLPMDVAHSAFVQSKEFKAGEIVPSKDFNTGQMHYLVNGHPFDDPQSAMAALKAFKDSQKKK